MRNSGFVIVCLAVMVLLGGAARSSASATEQCSTSGPRICADLVGTPDTVPPSSETSPHYISYVSHISNQGSQTATHVSADVQLSEGMVLESATSSLGTCSLAADATCTLGRLASGADATVEFVARAPETEGTATATLTISFDEHTNDAPTPDPKQDAVVAQENTTVKVPDGSAASFVPQGASLTLTTDPTNTGVTTATDPLIGQAIITTSPIDTTASIDEVSAPFTCPKRVICRGGDWFHAEIPGTFDPPLAFPLRWDSTLIPTSLSVKKFALIYTACLDGCKLQIISARCSSPNPAPAELPCLTGVAKLVDGDYVATLISNHNGHMR